MHALIKSEAYYLTHDPVITRWENRRTLRQRAESMRAKLRYAGMASTNVLTLTMAENFVIVSTGGRTFVVESWFVLANLEKLLMLQGECTQLRKFLEKASKREA